MTLRPCDAIFGLCLPYRKGVRPAVEVYFVAYAVPVFPVWGDGYHVRLDTAFIHGATT